MDLMPIESAKEDRAGPHPGFSQANREVAAQWNSNAQARRGQIRSGKDLSREFVIVPAMLEMLKPGGFQRLLDMGTGDGEFAGTVRDAGLAREIVGIDISEQMIELAQRDYQGAGCRFQVLEAEQAAREFGPGSFEAVTANMVFNTAPDLEGIVASAGEVLRPGGCFVFSLFHPAFFHATRTFQGAVPEGFDLSREGSFEMRFTISLDPEPLPSAIRFYHRPVAAYLKALQENGFAVADFLEPYPPEGLEVEYLDGWRAPRFLIMNAVRLEG